MADKEFKAIREVRTTKGEKCVLIKDMVEENFYVIPYEEYKIVNGTYISGFGILSSVKNYKQESARLQEISVKGLMKKNIRGFKIDFYKYNRMKFMCENIVYFVSTGDWRIEYDDAYYTMLGIYNGLGLDITKKIREDLSDILSDAEEFAELDGNILKYLVDSQIDLVIDIDVEKGIVVKLNISTEYHDMLKVNLVPMALRKRKMYDLYAIRPLKSTEDDLYIYVKDENYDLYAIFVDDSVGNWCIEGFRYCLEDKKQIVSVEKIEKRKFGEFYFYVAVMDRIKFLCETIRYFAQEEKVFIYNSTIKEDLEEIYGSLYLDLEEVIIENLVAIQMYEIEVSLPFIYYRLNHSIVLEIFVDTELGVYVFLLDNNRLKTFTKKLTEVYYAEKDEEDDEKVKSIIGSPIGALNITVPYEDFDGNYYASVYPKFIFEELNKYIDIVINEIAAEYTSVESVDCNRLEQSYIEESLIPIIDKAMEESNDKEEIELLYFVKELLYMIALDLI